MAERVSPTNSIFNKVFNLGAETFSPSQNAINELDRLTFHGQLQLTDTQLKQTLMYQENSSWIQTKLQQGYSAIDIGIDKQRLDRSVFYSLERSFVYK